MENWVNICEFNQKESVEWLLKLLEEEKIPHKEETKENWYGHRMPVYQQNKVIYVPKEYKEKVESYLKEYNNPNNVAYEDAEELRNISNDDDEQQAEINKGKMAKKILAIIPFAMLLVVIICGIITGFMYK